MTTREEIDQKYKAQHDELSACYYQRHEIPKEEFDRLHGELWDNHERELLDAGLIEPPQPERDLAAEIDELRATLAILEQR